MIAYKVSITSVNLDFAGRITAFGKIFGEFGQISDFYFARRGKSRRIARTRLKKQLHALAKRVLKD